MFSLLAIRVKKSIGAIHESSLMMKDTEHNCSSAKIGKQAYLKPKGCQITKTLSSWYKSQLSYAWLKTLVIE